MEIIDKIDLLSVENYIVLNLYIVCRLVLASILGSIIGLVRGRLNRPAGIRTHMIVCMASTLVMLLGIEMGKLSDIDVTRLAAQVVSGIGFLGAGAILKDGFSVRGLTTAATLWVVACVGLAVGGGFYLGAIFTTVFVFLSLKFMGSSSVKSKSSYISVLVHSVDSTVEEIKIVLVNAGIHISDVALCKVEQSDLKEIRFYGTIDNKVNTESLILDLLKIEGVKSAHLE